MNEHEITAIRNQILGPQLLALEQRAGFLGLEVFPATAIATSETTTSTTFADLPAGTVGPSLSVLPDGRYWIMFGASASNNTAAAGLRMSLSINAAAATDNDGWVAAGTDAGGYSRGLAVTLSAAAAGGTNSLVAKYRVGAGTGSFALRWLVAFRYANV